MRLRRLLPATCLLFPHAGVSAQAAGPADAVYVNARIWTGDSLMPSAEALAVRDGRIVRIGRDAAVRALADGSTRVVDLGGRRVVPGFIDAHWHLPTAARADLVDAGSVPEIVRRLQAWAARLPAGAWVVGRGWTPTDFPGNAPHKRFLDAAFPDRPVLITDRDGHQALANSVALRRANVTAATKDPVQGVIERGAGGEPTGLLKESASGLVSRLVPPPTAADVARRVDDESRAAAALGITMVHEASRRVPSGAVFDALAAAARADTLRLRWYVSVPFDPGATRAQLARYVQLRDAYRGPWLRYGIAKGMLDGTVDAQTAAMLEPYANTDATGLPFWSASVLKRGVARYDSAGLQVELHAIGDKAVRMALDAYAHARRVNGTRDSRHRVEHVEVPHPSDLPRFKALGVIASTQAIFATPDVTTLTNYAPLLGPKRAALSNNFRQFDDAGAVQAFGSDYPVFPMDVMRGIYTAVTRLTPEGTPRGGWYPAGRITVEAALRHYTRDAAYAAFMEQEVGTLRAGMLADFVVLSDDLLAVPPAELLRVRVERTVVGGREVYVRTGPQE
ncbi:MAG: amidohydrolase [Gemmatimonas sp.]|jgi:predicted amidohydrolase YtcJ|uniref:amidohydrolase n=1 Tax=Gemmatimonas sp. TaxID=1962908 RepID=UPI00391FB2FF|nr:amidohydrolase family protein [Gemmatimonadota bacterium]